MQGQFDKLLAQYTSLFKQMMSELMVNNKNNVMVRNLIGRNLKHDNNYYHINNYGFASVYDNEAWQKRSDSCNTPAIWHSFRDNMFPEFLTGPNMGVEQACGVAGYNIHNHTSGEQSWVDIKGVRHVYPSGVWDNRHASCQGTPRDLTDIEYKGIPEGTKMDPTTICQKLNVNPAIIKNLYLLNTKLQTLGKKLLANTTSLVGGNEHLQSEITQVHNNMMATMKRLEGDQAKLTDGFINLGNTGVQLDHGDFKTNVEGAKRSSELFLRMNYIKYLIGLILVVLLVIFSFVNYPSSEQSTIATFILLLVILVVLVHFWNFISQKLF